MHFQLTGNKQRFKCVLGNPLVLFKFVCLGIYNSFPVKCSANNFLAIPSPAPICEIVYPKLRALLLNNSK